jgi:HlyD family secretion protein
MRKRSRVILAATLLVLVAVILVWFVPRERRQVAPYRTEPVQRGDILVQVSATGTLDAVTTVQVGSQITGTIDALYADFNSQVKRGQVLALIDPTFLKAQVAQSEADLEKARVAQRQAERDLARQSPLREQGLASQADIDAAETALDAARASVKSAEAGLTRSKTNLAYATISSPIDGTVVSRDVDVGQTVAASLSAPTLFTIAQDLTQMQLEAAVDEADIGMVRVAQQVAFTVDAFPERTFSGTVHQIRLSPKTEQNVVSYTVVVTVPNPDQRLLPGMTANATFMIDEARDVLKVPSAALRFRPAATVGRAQEGGAIARNGAASGGSGRPGGSGPSRAMAQGGQGGGTGLRGQGQGGLRQGSDSPAGGVDRPGSNPSPTAAVYVLKDGAHLKRISVVPGLSDGTFTAVGSDSLSEGMQIVVGATSQTSAAPNQGQVNPFAPGGMRRGR